MKKIISVFLICALCFLFVSCSSETSEEVKDINKETSEEMSDEKENIEEIEYIDDSMEPNLTITLVDREGNFIDVEYRDGGVIFHFFGENEYQNGYAFIKDSKTMTGEAVFLVDGKGSDESEIIYIVKRGSSEVFISKSMENITEEGEYYYIQEQDIDLLNEIFLGNDGETQYWAATEVGIYSIDKQEIIVPESTYVSMTSTNNGGEININIQGNGEWIFDNHKSDLQYDGQFRGFYSGWDIFINPEGNTANVNIRYTDTEEYEMRSVSVVFEKVDSIDDIYNHIDIAKDSTPVVFLDKEMERLLAEHLNLPIGGIYKEHLELIEVIVIAGDSLYPYYTTEVYFSFSGLEFNKVKEGSITSLEDLKYCTNLKELYIGMNKINDISALENLTQLQIINLTSNEISDISALENLENLEKLTLDHNNISDASALSGLEKLFLLDLGSNNDNTFSDLESISKIKTLESLTLYNNACSDITALKNLTNLEFLSLSTNGITDVTPLKDLVNLEEIYLGQNYDLRDISALNDLENLRFLSVRKTAVTDTSQIPNLVSDADRYVEIVFE